jgi:transcriptional regulator with XRE-family HTH domain
MKNLGEKIREVREAKDVSLRELAKRLSLSPAFLSDVELGRRYPSKKVLRLLANELSVKFDDLEDYDTRPPIEEVRRRVQADPAFGIALRKVIDKQVSPDDLMKLVGEGTDLKKKKK